MQLYTAGCSLLIWTPVLLQFPVLCPLMANKHELTNTRPQLGLCPSHHCLVSKIRHFSPVPEACRVAEEASSVVVGRLRAGHGLHSWSAAAVHV